MIRRYQDGDERAISDIFLRCYSAYSGFVERSPQFWKWFNLDRPSSGRGRVLVATLRGKQVGALTLSENGSIIDPCYDPTTDGRAIMKRLLGEAEEIARKQGLGRITLVVPYDDPQMTGVCTDMGMRGRRSEARLTVLVHSFERFLPIVLARSQVPDGRYLLSVRSRAGDYRHFLLVSSHGEVSAARAEADAKADISVRINEVTLNGLIFSGKLGLGDLAMKRVQVRPIHRLMAGLAFLRCFRLGSKWFIPRGGVI